MKKKVLVVDDDRDIVAAVQSILHMENYSVITAYNGQDAVKNAILTIPQLILLDYMLPDMNGAQIAVKIKTTSKLKNVPIILFSAAREAPEIAKMKHIDAYLAKPFDLEELLTLVSRWTRVER